MMVYFADAAPQAAESGVEQTFVMIAVAFLFFYLVIMRPENKRRKALEAKRQGLKKGDRVIVAGGIMAEVFCVEEDAVIVSLHDGSQMKVIKPSIQDVKSES